jgi:hypothetical protein
MGSGRRMALSGRTGGMFSRLLPAGRTMRRMRFRFLLLNSFRMALPGHMRRRGRMRGVRARPRNGQRQQKRQNRA